MKRSFAWSVPLLLAAVLLLLGPLFAHLHLVAPIVGFMTFALSFIPGLVAVFFGFYLLAKGDLRRGFTSAVIGLIPVGLIAYTLVNNRDLPEINDISTNLDNPPTLTAAASAPDNVGKDLSYPDGFKVQVQASYPDLISLQLNVPPEAAYQLVKKAAEAEPTWHVLRDDPAALSLEGEDTSGLFQFTDDFSVRILPLAGGSQIDMRSRSRVGKGDFGANAKRIRTFFAAVQPRQG